jgi:hypothetical protein
LLRESKHDCGHGADVKPPLEIAIQWARQQGVTPALVASVRVFVAGLSGLRSVKAAEAKKKGGLLLLLDTEHPGDPACWSVRFRSALQVMPASERAAWERLVLYMGTALGTKPAKEFPREAEALLAFFGREHALVRLEAWFPDPAEKLVWPIGTAGSHVLKNMVWLVAFAGADSAFTTRCDALIDRLTKVDFTPRDPAMKVAQATAIYFAARPSEISAAPLERIRVFEATSPKSKFSTNRIKKIVDAAGRP